MATSNGNEIETKANMVLRAFFLYTEAKGICSLVNNLYNLFGSESSMLFLRNLNIEAKRSKLIFNCDLANQSKPVPFW